MHWFVPLLEDRAVRLFLDNTSGISEQRARAVWCSRWRSSPFCSGPRGLTVLLVACRQGQCAGGLPQQTPPRSSGVVSGGLFDSIVCQSQPMMDLMPSAVGAKARHFYSWRREHMSGCMPCCSHSFRRPESTQMVISAIAAKARLPTVPLDSPSSWAKAAEAMISGNSFSAGPGWVFWWEVPPV